MKPNLLLLQITCLLLTNIQCSKTPKSQPNPAPIACDSANTVLIPEDMKARFFFKEGTYWIYKNVNSGYLDSMWVYYSNNTIAPVDKNIHAYGWNKCYETFSLKIHNKDYISNKYYVYYDISQHPINAFDLSKELFEIQQISPINPNKVSYHVGIEGLSYFNDFGGEILLNASIITSGNNSYNNLLNIYYPNGTSNDIYSNMYYAKNIGLVKFVRSSDNSTWELIRFKINQ